ncbi:MAG: DUF4212 domain-containing protein [Myxococcales bacterium]|nr:DUF4212 domain-containing protein [Myxococcales bacterium]
MTTEPEKGNDRTPHSAEHATRYWKRNLRLLVIFLAVWWVVSYGAGILWVDALDEITIPGTGFPLGFWFAQQGSIYVFVALIFLYTWMMNKLDKEFDVHED